MNIHSTDTLKEEHHNVSIYTKYTEYCSLELTIRHAVKCVYITNDQPQSRSRTNVIVAIIIGQKMIWLQIICQLTQYVRKTRYCILGPR